MELPYICLTTFQIIEIEDFDLVVLQMGCNELKHMFNLTAGMIAFGAVSYTHLDVYKRQARRVPHGV